MNDVEGSAVQVEVEADRAGAAAEASEAPAVREVDRVVGASEGLVAHGADREDLAADRVPAAPVARVVALRGRTDRSTLL